MGGERDIEVHPRVIAATNKDLKAEIAKGTFREDLYHRLSVIVITVPPLRSRKEDIPELVEYFLQSISADHGVAKRTIAPAALAALTQLPWHGNIRELRNVVERLMILTDGPIGLEAVKRYAM